MYNSCIILPFLQSIYFLPRSHNEATEKKLRHMMKQLAILSEQEQRLAALLTLTGTQDDPGMIALRVIFKQLVQNTCDLVSVIMLSVAALANSFTTPPYSLQKSTILSVLILNLKS